VIDQLTTPCTRILLKKLVVIELVKNSLPFTVSEGSLLCSQKPSTGAQTM